MEKETGGPAFPRPAGDFNGSRHGNGAQTGMTLRDYFAAKAMQEMVNEYDDFDFMAQTAYAVADAMLKERNK